MNSNDDVPLVAALHVGSVEGLRVADASVLLRQPGKTMTPTIGTVDLAARINAEAE